MKKLSFVIALGLAACSTSPTSRKVASEQVSLAGDFLGYGDYGWFREGPDKPAIRIYLAPIAEEPGSYNVILHEYYGLLRTAPQFVASDKKPELNKTIGYLKHISRRIDVYRAVPSSRSGTLDLLPLKVINGEIVPVRVPSPRQLILSDKAPASEPMADARITAGGSDKETEVWFPAKADESYRGLQYKLAKWTYTNKKLNSTWRKEFLPGPYLAAYAKLDDVVLKLSSNGGQNAASFVLWDGASRMSIKDRENIFTNPKSAFLFGDYSVSEPQDGMFVFAPAKAEQAGVEHVTGRIGLFVDIFDATESLNKDVVELALVNPEDPYDFLMYYEHPDNGEGAVGN
jgi:hypothetical protein